MEVTSHRIEVIYAAILPLYNLCYLHTLQLASERSHHGSPVPDLPASPNPKLLPYNVSGPPNRPHLASLHLIPSTHHSVEPKPIRSRPVGSRAALRRPEPEAQCYVVEARWPPARSLTRPISFIQYPALDSALVLYHLPPCSSTPSAYLHSSFVPHSPQHVTNHVAANPGAIVLDFRDCERPFASLYRPFDQRRL